MDRIYILDAVNYLFRSYYAIGPMLNDKGQSTSALFGFIRSVQKLIRDFHPTHFVCVFDGPDNKKSRRAVYADYKMHRKGAPEDLFPQFELAYDYCEMAGIPVLCVEGVEADDTMATVALWAEKKGAKAFLCSSDKDLMQLVNDNILQLQLHKDNLIIDAAKVKELFGVRPDQMLDLLSIMGDASDNIPGLEGFGPKTAASLLQEFGTLDNILAHPERVKGEKKQEILRTQKSEALMSRELATLHTRVEIPQDVEFYQIKEMDKEKLSQFFQEMKFNSLLRELSAPQPERKIPPTDASLGTPTHNASLGTPETKCKAALHLDKHDYHLVDDEASLKTLIKRLDEAKEIGIDTETTNIHPLLAHLVGIGFSIEPGEAWYVPINGKLGKQKVVETLRHFFSSTSAGFYGQNFKYDYHILQNLSIPVKKIAFDTLLASYLLSPQTRRHNLDDLALEKFKRVKIPIESLIGKGKKEISMRDVPIEKVKDYCCEDIDYTTRLKVLFEEELKERGLERLLRDIELPLLPILAGMEKVGIYLDLEKLREEGVEVTREIHKVKKIIFEETGGEFNLNSPKQLSEVLYQKLGIQSKTASTSADVLEELEHPIAIKILEYRTLEKLRSTYIDALPEAVNPITGRIHCTFNQSVAATGRLSCQDPNLQNIPLHSAIRSCFKPEKEGWSFLGADYSQIELRLLAHFSQDKELMRAFNGGRDIHIHTASLVFGVAEGEVTPEMRSAAKTVNFGIVYGQSPFGLSKQLGISMREASDFIKTYFERYPGVLNYLELCKTYTKKTGVSKTLTGRERPIPEIHNRNPSIRSAAERLAINTPLQGTAADLIKMAMIEIDRVIREKKLKGQMILQIHDELIFEIPDEEIAVFQEIVKEKMEQVMKLNVPIEVHIAVGKNWAEC